MRNIVEHDHCSSAPVTEKMRENCKLAWRTWRRASAIEKAVLAGRKNKYDLKKKAEDEDV